MASNWPVQECAGEVGAKRIGPAGGDALGTPRNAATPPLAEGSCLFMQTYQDCTLLANG